MGENENTKEKKEKGRRFGMIMRNVARTFAHKKDEVKELMLKSYPDIPKDAPRGKWVSTLMQGLREDEEFRLSFAEIMIERKKGGIGEKIRERVREVGGNAKVRREEAKKRVENILAKRNLQVRQGGKGNNEFLGFEGQQLPETPEQLAGELKEAADNSTEESLNTLVKKSEQAKNSTNVMIIAGVVALGFYVFKKYIKK